MEKDSESWLHCSQLDEQLPNVKSSKLPLSVIGMQRSCFPCAIPCTFTASTSADLPTFGFSGLTDIKLGQRNEPHGWFHCLPPLVDNNMPKANLPGTIPGNGKFSDVNKPASKQFLVFDQTGNKTTMMFSSGISTSIPRPTGLSYKPVCPYNFNEDGLKIRNDGHYSEPNLTDYSTDDQRSIVGSDMREDSEEIDALLYSDEEDDYSDDSEETSTGHSPSTLTAYEKHEWFHEDDMDEVSSSCGPVKRQKLSESNGPVPTVTYTANSVNPSKSFEYEEDDAESSCAGGNPIPFSDISNKRKRREKIRETVSVLQTILPDGKGKDAITVLDEAINYLRTLKSTAESLDLSGCSDE